MKILFAGLGVLLFLLAAGPVLVLATGQASLHGDWRTANRDSTATAPDPAMHPPAVVQVYAARAFSWRGVFGVHTWIAVKERDGSAYEVFEVLGWRARHGGSAVRTSSRAPDTRWFGSDPEALVDLRGDAAARLIEPIRAAVRGYPFERRYEIWPGPNSNTFVAHVVHEVPGLEVELPVTAVGKDYRPGIWFGAAASGTGYRLGIAGLLGVTAALDEGVEFNILGLSFGIDFLRPALKLPGIGRIGMS